MSDRQQARAVLWDVLAKSKTRLKGVIVARYHPISLTIFHKPIASPSSGRSDLCVFGVAFLFYFSFVIYYSALSISVLPASLSVSTLFQSLAIWNENPDSMAGN